MMALKATVFACGCLVAYAAPIKHDIDAAVMQADVKVASDDRAEKEQLSMAETCLGDVSMMQLSKEMHIKSQDNLSNMSKHIRNLSNGAPRKKRGQDKKEADGVKVTEEHEQVSKNDKAHEVDAPTADSHQAQNLWEDMRINRQGQYDDSMTPEPRRYGNCLSALGPGTNDTDFRADWTEKMYELHALGWNELPSEPYIRMKPKLAILMFTADKILNEQVWMDWIQRARFEGLDFALHIHLNKGSSSDVLQTPFRRYLVNEFWNVTWCNMWSAQMSLMARALEDKSVSHVIIVSHNSIPVKPLKFIYERLKEDPATRMCTDDKWRGNGWTPRAETWWLMRKEDARLFIDNKEVAGRFANNSGCVDEQAWYYPLKMRQELGGQRSGAVKDECIMFTDWADGPRACKDWARVVRACTGSGCGSLRASPHEYASNMHPATFLRVRTRAMQGLIDSPFWFARKFSDHAIKPHAAELLRASS